MGRGDGAIKAALETDIAAIVDARAAVLDLQTLSWDLARRRWTANDGETFQRCLQRLDLGLGVVHRWMTVLRRVMSQHIELFAPRADNTSPPKETSESAA